jgi:hypothetical protein
VLSLGGRCGRISLQIVKAPVRSHLARAYPHSSRRRFRPPPNASRLAMLTTLASHALNQIGAPLANATKHSQRVDIRFMESTVRGAIVASLGPGQQRNCLVDCDARGHEPAVAESAVGDSLEPSTSGGTRAMIFQASVMLHDASINARQRVACVFCHKRDTPGQLGSGDGTGGLVFMGLVDAFPLIPRSRSV